MGIDVHKMIGYGLVDVEYDGTKLTDPRINLDSPLLAYDANYETYVEFLQRRKAEGDLGYSELAILSHWREDRKKPDPQHCFHWAAEFGLGNVLILAPVWMPDWHRRADIIDWLEESHAHDQQDRVQTFTDGIYPFSGLYMDVRTGQRLSSDVMTYIRCRNSEDKIDEPFKEQIAQACTGMSWEEAGQYVMPVIPDEIRNLADCFELFLDPATILQLRPMLHVWWS